MRSSFYYFLAFVCCSALVLFPASLGLDRLRFRGEEEVEEERSMVGGVRESSKAGSENSAEIEDLARFAVDEHNKKQNTLLEFVGVVKAKEQVVAGKMYYLTVEAIEDGKKKLYEAKVWVKPWLNFKELQEFTPLADSSSGVTAADLGAKQGD